MDQRDSHTGEYNETYPSKMFIDALEALDGEIGTKDVEEAVGCEYRTALAKLKELEEQDMVATSRVGNAYVWRLAKSTASESSQPELKPEQDASTAEDEEGPMQSDGPCDPLEEWE